MESFRNLVFMLSLIFSLPEMILAQKPFQGSFLMTFESAEPEKDPPLFWNVKPDSAGGKMVLQIQDEMLKKGVNKRVLFKPADSTWTMVISFNKIKQGTRIHAAAMYRDTMKHRTFNITKTKEVKKIENYNCKKIIVESDLYKADVWYTDAIKFDMCGVYRLLSHCGMMSENVRKGDWFMNRKLKSMVLEVTSTKKSGGQTYSMRISQIGTIIQPEFFSIEDFKISDIPEGQNCGVMLKEEE